MKFTVKSLFSSAGRSGRKRYWAILVAGSVVGTLLRLLVTWAGENPILIVMAPIGIALAVIGINNYIKRLHDIGRSGWWFLALVGVCVVGGVLTGLIEATSEGGAIAMVALVYLIFLGFMIGLGCIRGDAGENRYGPPPAGPAAEAAS